MKHALRNTLGLIFAATVVFATAPTTAQTTANGPYYATPSWDQTLPSITRFIVLSNFNNAAVLDRETGLVWEKSPDATTQDWEIAQILCVQKNVGGREGWKLPSIQELGSLADTTQSNPALPAGHPFTNVQSSGYWAATTSAISSGDAWDIEFFSGGISRISKSSALHIWCVRGGPGGDSQ